MYFLGEIFDDGKYSTFRKFDSLQELEQSVSDYVISYTTTYWGREKVELFVITDDGFVKRTFVADNPQSNQNCRLIEENDMEASKMYVAVLDEFPDFMVPTLVAHSVLSAHIKFQDNDNYNQWLKNSFKKCVVRVNQKEFDKISQLENVHLGHEVHTLDGKPSCVVVCPMQNDDNPKALKFAKLWKPKNET